MTEQDNNKKQEETTQDSVVDAAANNSSDEDIEIVTDENLGEEEQEVLDLEQQIEQLTQDVAQEREKYLRALADLDNLRKRSRRDVEEARANGRINVLEELLPALDSIDMALKSIEPTEANQAVFDGMLMVQRQFLTSMERFELKPIQAKGEKFDPAIHEAVSYVPSPEHEAGDIIEEMRSGYKLGERLIRASMVVVSSGPPAESATDGADAEEANSTDEADTTSETQSADASDDITSSEEN